MAGGAGKRSNSGSGQDGGRHRDGAHGDGDKGEGHLQARGKRVAAGARRGGGGGEAEDLPRDLRLTLLPTRPTVRAEAAAGFGAILVPRPPLFAFPRAAGSIGDVSTARSRAGPARAR